MSENFAKEFYGKDFWAKLMYARNKTWWHTVPSILIVTDIGFSAEVEFLCQHSSGYLGVRMDRPNTDGMVYDFSLDSRNYVASQLYGGQDFALTNDDTPEAGAKAILERMFKLGWPVVS
jgi:hypothetical protein